MEQVSEDTETEKLWALKFFCQSWVWLWIEQKKLIPDSTPQWPLLTCPRSNIRPECQPGFVTDRGRVQWIRFWFCPEEKKTKKIRLWLTSMNSKFDVSAWYYNWLWRPFRVISHLIQCRRVHMILPSQSVKVERSVVGVPCQNSRNVQTMISRWISPD